MRLIGKVQTIRSESDESGTSYEVIIKFHGREHENGAVEIMGRSIGYAELRFDSDLGLKVGDALDIVPNTSERIVLANAGV